MNFTRVLVLLLMLAATGVHAADSYDPVTRLLTIPVLGIGNATYTDVVVEVDKIIRSPSGSLALTNADVYDPATGQLSVASVTLDSTTYHNALVSVAGVVAIGGVTGADAYDGERLSITSVQAGTATYGSVVATVSAVVGVGTGLPLVARDQYDSGNGELLIPAVTFGGRLYTNVRVKVGAILSLAGAPITAPAAEWTWAAFPDAFCANGTTTGIGINPGTDGSRVLIYLEGGGACWSELTCYTLMTAANFTTGYGESNFVAEATDPGLLALPGGFFDRTSPGNPFRDYSYVYIPYCTGDVHAGSNTVAYDAVNTAMQVGYANFTAYLRRLVPTFPGATQVTLAGSSAGGFGALINWDQTQKAFGTVPVYLIDDSGTPMPPDIFPVNGATYQAWLTNWNLAAAFPAGCGACASRLDSLWAYYASAYPADRAALLSYQQDTVLPYYYGISTPQFTAGLVAEEALIGANANQEFFTVNAAGHVLFFSPQLAAVDATLQQWLTGMVTGDPTWASIAAP